MKAILTHKNSLVFDFVHLSDVELSLLFKPFQSKLVDFLGKIGLNGKEVYYLELLATQKN